MNLAARVAIITGASRGIGREIAQRYAQEGAKLVLNHRSHTDAMNACVDACQKLGAPVEVVQADVGLPGVAEQICDRACARFGRVDVLVNNAGIAHEDLLLTLRDDAMEEMISTNVMGVVRMTRAAAARMIRQHDGSVINVSSILARRPGRGNAVYAGTKGFVESFTRAMAVELGPKGIRVNAIAPGIVETALSQGVRAVAGRELRERIALRRFGTPAEIADAAVFLATEGAAYVSGTVLEVDGGFAGGG